MALKIAAELKASAKERRTGIDHPQRRMRKPH
jgi:hypothetical protein